MSFNKSSYIIALVFVWVFLSSCSGGFQRILEKENDPDKLLAAANKYYDAEDYRKAMDLYEKVQPMMSIRNEAEMIAFRLGMGNYKAGNYLLSDFYFRRFHETYGRSPMAEEAFYLQAYSQYKEAPKSSLDSQKTRQAINTLQAFMNRFPGSERNQEAARLIDELRGRLEKKAYDTALLYWRLSDGIFAKSYLEASLLTFENFEREFPDSIHREEFAFRKIQAQYKIAANSILDKRVERYRKTLEFYDEFIRQYPESRFMNDAVKLYDRTVSEIQKLTT